MGYYRMNTAQTKDLIKYIICSEKSFFYRLVGNEEKEERLLDQMDGLWYKMNEDQTEFVRCYFQYISHYFWYIPEELKELYIKYKK
jgi:hypothetical protein